MGVILLPNGSGGVNPIFIPSQTPKCPHCHKDENIKQVCDNCGYVYPEPKGEEMGTIEIIFCSIVAILIAVIVAVGLFLSVDYFVFGFKYTDRIQYGNECNFQVPSGYKLVYDSNKKVYAIEDANDKDGQFLWTGSDGHIQWMYGSISYPEHFVDSCTAKAFLHKYIIQQQQTFK